MKAISVHDYEYVSDKYIVKKTVATWKLQL